MEEPCAPEAGAAGNTLRVTILFKVLALNVVTECEAAVKTKGEMVIEDTFPEGAIGLIIPDLEDSFFTQTAEYPRLDLLLPSADIAPRAMPEEITRMDLAVP